MRTQVKRSIFCLIGLAVLCSVVYPLLVTLVGQLVFPNQASGSLIKVGDHVVGSEWMAQNFSSPKYFHPRPSAAGNGYDAANSGGSNLGPTNKKLVERIKADVDKYIQENPGIKVGEVPVDMVTTSASGLDPHITPEAAISQVKRVASARNISDLEVSKLVERSIEGPQFGLLGDPAVNVLKLNIALDQLK